jgi:hypothetical protein
MIVPAVHRRDVAAATARLTQTELHIDLGSKSVQQIALTRSPATDSLRNGRNGCVSSGKENAADY